MEETNVEQKAVAAKKKAGFPLALLIPLAAFVIVIFVHWLTTGDDLCPADANPLRMYAQEHNLHYKAEMLQSLKGGDAYWCAQLWPRGKHWYSDESWYSTGTPGHPGWKMCGGAKLSEVVAGLLADHAQKPDGNISYVPDKTLSQCQH